MNDRTVTNVRVAIKQLERIAERLPELRRRDAEQIGPDGYGWRVYTDPIGHPFCLCRNKGVIWTDQGLIWP